MIFKYLSNLRTPYFPFAQVGIGNPDLKPALDVKRKPEIISFQTDETIKLLEYSVDILFNSINILISQYNKVVFIESSIAISRILEKQRSSLFKEQFTEVNDNSYEKTNPNNRILDIVFNKMLAVIYGISYTIINCYKDYCVSKALFNLKFSNTLAVAYKKITFFSNIFIKIKTVNQIDLVFDRLFAFLVTRNNIYSIPFIVDVRDSINTGKVRFTIS
ncbi:hypothetical protein [Chryseobacterium turcicum]|uniref:Uncharacterized protein n=1 Tax=Chryseobacterium turcicum TaxID=2898076 RepID=A0A9Q3V4V7_9FLAO|nr:hypothetical protein [Chryseobacterium turcicum]MCD1117788.1 hypothetical protein [Chryseobacterium turcicum]